MHTSHDYIWYDRDKWAPRFCYVDKETCPGDLLGAVWRFHPGLVAYVEEDGDIWSACVSVRINGTHTERIHIPAGILHDALRYKILKDADGKEYLQETTSGKAL